MKTNYINSLKSKIMSTLYLNGEKGISAKDITAALRLSKKDKKSLSSTLAELVDSGFLSKSQNKKYFLKNRNNFFIGEISGISSKFGFVKPKNQDKDLFVPGHDLQGAIVGDKVLGVLMEEKGENRSAVGKILSILEENESLLSGTIIRNGMRLMVMPDSFSQIPLTILKAGKKLFSVNDKVLFKIFKRGSSHSEHCVQIIDVLGNSDSAKVCVNAYLASNSIAVDFSELALLQAEEINQKGIDKKELKSRLDLRELDIFTIDGADTKDIDDAVSIEKCDSFYRLGVHIADVSHYVKRNSDIEKEAFKRGTSIYFANAVIPMLPPALSNGICSLNPRTNRLAFSCFMQINFDGKLLNYSFHKSLIRSRVKGVYEEINRIFEGNPTKAILKKYEKVMPYLKDMRELSDILKQAEKKRGAPEISSDETKLTLDENGKCVDVGLRQSGISQGMIEQFMLMANRSAASLAIQNKLPFVYRVHEKPPTDKIAELKRVLDTLNINTAGLNANAEPKVLADILNTNKDHERFRVINRLVLRSMSKAKYSEEPIGHYGLVLNDYAHFTSPIRRYSDLAVHRILADFISNNTQQSIVKKYTDYARDSARKATITELNAIKCERECTDFYTAEYMSLHIGSSFKGIVSGVNNQGIFVQLENSIEGFVPLQSLPDGIYESINGISLLNQLSGKSFTIGDKIVVRCVNTNVSMGEIEFDLPEYEDDINRNIKNTTAKQSTGKRPSRENKSDFAQSLEKSTRASRNNPYPKLKKGRSHSKQNKRRRPPKQ